MKMKKIFPLCAICVFALPLVGCGQKRIDIIQVADTKISEYSKYTEIGVANNESFGSVSLTNKSARKVSAEGENGPESNSYGSNGYLSGSDDKHEIEYVTFDDSTLSENYFINEYGDFGNFAYMKYIFNDYKGFVGNTRIYGESTLDVGKPLNNEMNVEGLVYILNKNNGDLYSIDSLVFDLFVEATTKAAQTDYPQITDIEGFCKSNYYFYRSFWDEHDKETVVGSPSLIPVVFPEVNSNKFIIYIKPHLTYDEDERIPKQDRALFNSKIAKDIYQKYLFNIYEFEVKPDGLNFTGKQVEMPVIDPYNDGHYKYPCIIDRYNNLLIGDSNFISNYIDSYGIISIDGNVKVRAGGSFCPFFSLIYSYSPGHSSTYYGPNAKPQRNIEIIDDTCRKNTDSYLLGVNSIKLTNNSFVRYGYVNFTLNTFNPSIESEMHDLYVISYEFSEPTTSDDTLRIRLTDQAFFMPFEILHITPDYIFAFTRYGVLSIIDRNGNIKNISTYNYFGGKQCQIVTFDTSYTDIIVFDVRVEGDSALHKVAVDPVTLEYTEDINSISKGFSYLKSV